MKDKILNSYLEGFSTDFGYKASDTAKQFELFASYCVVCHNYTDVFDIENSIVGDGNDTGIDSIAILINGKVCNDIVELEDFIKINTKINVQFVFTQAKMSSSFECKEVSNFGNGIIDFFKDSPSLIINDDIKKYREMKELIYKNARKFYPQNPECIMFYIAAGKFLEDQNLTSIKNKIITDLENLNCLSSINLEYVDCDKLYKMYQSITRGTEKEIEMEHYIVLPETNDVDEALLGRISCKQFMKLICDDDGIFDQNIFSDNIRDYLGNSSVNKEIENTIRDEAQRNYFILLNNGVTAVAKKIQRTKNNLIIDNIQIVNGCQTSNVLYRNRGLLTEEMYLPIKIISTTNQDIINAIIKSTNRQNRVEPEAFEALSGFHRKFEEFCKAMNSERRSKLYYERRSKQYITDESVKPIEIVTLSNLLYATIAMFMEEPHSTHRYYGELLKMNKEKIFLDTHNLEPYYFFAYCLKKITIELRRDIDSKKHFISRYYALMYLWKTLTKNKKYHLNSEKLARKILTEYLPIVDDRKEFLRICAEGIKLFYKIAKDNKVEAKNIARTRKITDEMLRAISENALN